MAGLHEPVCVRPTTWLSDIHYQKGTPIVRSFAWRQDHPRVPLVTRMLCSQMERTKIATSTLLGRNWSTRTTPTTRYHSRREEISVLCGKIVSRSSLRREREGVPNSRSDVSYQCCMKCGVCRMNSSTHLRFWSLDIAIPSLSCVFPMRPLALAITVPNCTECREPLLCPHR